MNSIYEVTTSAWICKNKTGLLSREVFCDLLRSDDLIMYHVASPYELTFLVTLLHSSDW